MRIRPVIVTAIGTGIALCAVAIVVFASTPQDAEPGLICLLWSALALSAWGFTMTLLLFARQSMARAVWVGLLPALAGIAMLFARQRGMLSQQLLKGMILATLSLSVIIWWRLRRTPKHG